MNYISYLSRSILGLSFLCFCIPGLAQAAGPPGLSLLRPDSLLGWDAQGEENLWKINKGRLSGTQGDQSLLTEWTFSDFQVEFRWNAHQGEGWTIGFLSPTGPSESEVQLRAEGVCGIFTKSKNSLSEETIPPVKNSYQTVIKRSGDSISLIIEGKLVGAAKVPSNRRLGLVLKTSDDSAWMQDLQVKEPIGQSLFNGKDLSGWWTPGKKEAWHAEDGQIVKRGGGGNYLRTKKEFANFTLSMEYKVGKGANAGIGIRTTRGGWPSSDGMELQILDRPGTGSGSNMSIYRNVVPVAEAHRSEAWNHVVVKAEGYMVSAWMNGVLVQHFNTRNHPELKYRHLRGWIGLQDHGSVNYFRNIAILEAPDGLGLPQWYRQRTLRGADLVLDRLMNPQRLSVADGILSSTTTSSSLGSEQVVANLKGPGALVRISRTSSQGRLAFYFDGETKPRIDIPANQLRSKLPDLTEESEPFLTYVSYRKSLKIVLREAKQAHYQIDHLTFPKGVEVSTFVDTKASIPRGWMETIDYRRHHFKHGQHRQIDPLPRERVQGKKIEPGKAVSLVSLPGAGVVHYWKLRCPKGTLGNNDLWVDVAVDGEPRPTLSAPARYLFASIVDGKNHSNFVAVDRDGPTTRLALPFGKGITLSVRNAGSKVISGIGMEVCYEPLPQTSHSMRLHGVFQDRSNVEGYKISGSGRVVGIVWNQPEGDPFQGLPVRADGTSWVGPVAKPSDEALFLGATGRWYDFRRCLSGRSGGLAWRYLWLAPREFQESLEIDSQPGSSSEMLILYYRKP